MPPRSKRVDREEVRSLVGWNGLLFTVPGDWNVTGFSTDKTNGYLKVDSAGSMFLQAKWTEGGPAKPKTLGEMALQMIRGATKRPVSSAGPPDLRGMLESFLKTTGKQARKSGKPFDCKIKPAVTELGGVRTGHNFAWTGAGQGQGKIWHCSACSRTVIVQVVGQAKDPVADVAAGVLGDIRDHSDDGWIVWALFDLVAAAPAGYELRAHKLMSGYLRLELVSRASGRIVIERWGLAHIARRKFTLPEWMTQMCNASQYRPAARETTASGHEAVRLDGRVRAPLAVAAAIRDGLPKFRPALMYEACAWECPETDKLYALQSWRPPASPSPLEEMVVRCECH